MRRLSAKNRVAAFVFALWPSLWIVAAQADECDGRVAVLVATVPGVTAAETRGADSSIEIRAKYVNETSVDCPMPGLPGMAIDLFVNWDGAFPPVTFYHFAGRAAHIVVGVSEEAARLGAMKCQQAALRSADETAKLIFADAYFECQAFSRDGGGTAISIYPKSSAPPGSHQH